MASIKRHFYSITTPPLLPILLAYILGILWQACILSTPIIVLLCFFFIAIYFFQTNQLPLSALHSILCILLFSSGALLYKKNIDDYHHFYTFANNTPVSITGIISDINTTTVCRKKTTVVTLNIHTITNGTTTQNNNKYLLLYIKNNTLTVGNEVALFNIICKKPNNDHSIFYQIKENIIATVFVKNLKYNIISHPTWPLRRWFFDLKQKILCRCQEKLSPESFLLFTSLFLGNRSYVKDSMDNVNEHFKRWGIFHFISRSGLHLALFICTWQFCFYYIPLPLIAKNIVLIIITLIYALLSWSSLPFARSLMLLVCSKMSTVAQTSYNLLHCLTLICVCFLLYNPLYLFFLDFQLTFGITFALAWFNQLHNQHLYQESLLKIANY